MKLTCTKCHRAKVGGCDLDDSGKPCSRCSKRGEICRPPQPRTKSRTVKKPKSAPTQAPSPLPFVMTPAAAQQTSPQASQLAFTLSDAVYEQHIEYEPQLPLQQESSAGGGAAGGTNAASTINTEVATEVAQLDANEINWLLMALDDNTVPPAVAQPMPGTTLVC